MYLVIRMQKIEIKTVLGLPTIIFHKENVTIYTKLDEVLSDDQIRIKHRDLVTIPSELLKLITDKIKFIDFSNNKITDFPLDLCRSKARVLNFKQNQIRKLPNCLNDISTLEDLDFSQNRLLFLPPSIRNIKATRIDLSGNPLISLYPLTASQLEENMVTIPNAVLAREIRDHARTCEEYNDCGAIASFYRDSTETIAKNIVLRGKATNREVIRLCHEGKYDFTSKEIIEKAILPREIKDHFLNCFKGV